MLQYRFDRQRVIEIHPVGFLLPAAVAARIDGRHGTHVPVKALAVFPTHLTVPKAHDTGAVVLEAVLHKQLIPGAVID